jgi:RNA polymerase sigma-70 factor (ECF subfamily)
VSRTDAELLREHLAGDRHAFTELAQRHYPALWSLARRTLDDRKDAREAVQDALLRAHQAAGGYRADAAVRTWLIRILINICRDRYRRNRFRSADAAQAEELAALPDRRDPIADHECRLLVAQALAALPIEQRLVIELVNLQGYPVEEVADMLNVSVGTVKSRGNRGRVRMAEALGLARPLQLAAEQR